MSTGFCTDASGGRTSRSRRTVSWASGGTCNPFASQVSAQRIPRPPAFVTIPTPSPPGGGWFASSVATSNISSRVSVRITPAWWNRASTVTSEACRSAPVWEAAARAPALLRPLFTATIGLRRPIRRARRAKRRGFPNDSR